MPGRNCAQGRQRTRRRNPFAATTVRSHRWRP
jgi:hypothetical protein